MLGKTPTNLSGGNLYLNWFGEVRVRSSKERAIRRNLEKVQWVVKPHTEVYSNWGLKKPEAEGRTV